MMSRFFSLLKIHPGEERKFILLAGLMLSTSAGSVMAGNAVNALFYKRFGVEQLPVMYVILGIFTFASSMAVTALMGRIPKKRIYLTLPLVLGVTVLAGWFIIPLDIKWFFALMWLGLNVINSLQGLLTWRLAGVVCDTRQAKRLFPLFTAGSISGAVLGGLVTQPLANWLHAENLILFWAGALLLASLLGRALTGHLPAQPVLSRGQQPGVWAEMTRGYQFVRRSRIMQWVSYSAILFSICFRALDLPFSRGATLQFSNADQLAGFFGLFESLTTITALLLSLFLASRLFARFGIMPMLLVFPLIYLAGFGVLSIAAPFGLLVGVRFAQMAYMNGIADSSWQSLFNVVTPEHRDQVRAFVGGVPEQLGTIIAGLILLAGDNALQPQQMYLIGLAASAVLAYFIWRASRDYSQALVAALRAGQPQLFFSEEHPFSADAAAVAVALRGLGDPEPGIRRVSAEIVGNLPVPEAAPALVNALLDDDALVRVAALKGLTRARAASALLEISASLSDPEPDVRIMAIDSLRQLAASSRGVVAHIEPLLADVDPFVRIQAAKALLQTGKHALAREQLHAMLSGSNAVACARALDVLGECDDEPAFELAVRALDDIRPVMRVAAAGAAARLNPQKASDPLIQHLNDDDSSVRQALAGALGKIGAPALEKLVEALANPSQEAGALMALAHLPTQPAAGKIRAHARAAAQTALHYHNLALGVAHLAGGDDRLGLLRDSLHDKAQRSGLNALRALGLVSASETVAVALENLPSRDPTQRANALETLESVGEREIIQPLLALWESGDKRAASLPVNWLADLLDDPYAWLRACAVLVAAQRDDPALREKLMEMSRYDPDETVRAVAANLLVGEPAMETLATLSLMERILFLRRVPLFAELPPADLKQVAALTREVLFVDGQELMHQGDPGYEMYIVVTGDVRVLISSEEQQNPHSGLGPGAPREVAIRHAGDYIGEMSIISSEPRIATLVAAGEVRALCLDQKQFERILRERPETSLALMQVLFHRLKEASERATLPA